MRKDMGSNGKPHLRAVIKDGNVWWVYKNLRIRWRKHGNDRSQRDNETAVRQDQST